MVDPGVGTERLSVVLKTKNGQYFVTPDNGTLTLVADKFGIDEVRQINESINRRKNSEKSYTFHGRDVYAYTAAKLASGKITFEQVGKKLPPNVVKINYQKAVLKENRLLGTIPVLDAQYGNVWTNISRTVASPLNLHFGDQIKVKISHNDHIVFDEIIPFANSFGNVTEGKNLVYFNSLDNLSLAINMGNFADVYHIKHGANWIIEMSKVD